MALIKTSQHKSGLKEKRNRAVVGFYDPTLDTFSRQEAVELIPKSNPFLRKLFGYIAGPDIDDRIKWIVDNLTEVFLACNVEEILENYGKTTKMEDPIIHFYETFLAEYDPKLRKARGVWYTPREKYKEFLKIDFAKVPFPKDQNTFWELVKLSAELRQIHLLESSKVEEYITSYPKDGDNVITTKTDKKNWELFDEEKQLGRIWINEEQYFDNIPLTAWEFYIGGYQPAQKWLKDRRERTLEFEDILHY